MGNKPSEIDFKIPTNYFKQTVANLQWGGIPLNDIQHPILKYFYYAYTAFMLTIFIYFFTITEIICLYESTHNLEIFFFTMSYLVAHLIGCAKITVLLVRRRSIRNFLRTIEEGTFLPNIERGGIQEIQLVKEAVARSATQVKTWWSIIFIMLSNRIIWIALNPTTEVVSPDNPNATITVRQLPYTSSYIISFDMNASPFYELVFIHQVIGVWSFGWYMGNADNISNGLMIHLKAQFKILCNAFGSVTKRAQRLTEQRMCGITKQLNPAGKGEILYERHPTAFEEIPKYEELFLKNLQKCLRDCIQHHQDLLDLSQDMENTFNLMLLMQFVGCLTLYCFQLYQLSLMSITDTTFIGMCFFMFAMIFQLLLFCWNGNELSIASEAVADAAYNVDWIPIYRKVKLYIQMVIQRAQRPVYITAGKFSTLSMATFATILRGSMSYFMVLHKINDEEETAM